jgi:hypothetical protein
MSAVRLSLVALAVVVAAPGVTPAQDKSPAVAKQRETAAEVMKQINVTKPAVVETANLLVYSTLPEEKAKAAADAGQKAFDAARKALKADAKDKLWVGKLTAFVLPERREFTPLVRMLESRKPDDDETRLIKVRGDEPFVAVGLAAKGKATDAAIREELAAAVAAAVLDQKAGVGDPPADNLDPVALPNWLRDGFGRAVAVRLDPRALDAHRTRLKGLFAKPRLSAFQAANVWGGEAAGWKDGDTYTTSLVEYMVYGPDADKFAKFLAGYKPTTDRRNPDTASALEDARWVPERLDSDWKTWVLKGK